MVSLGARQLRTRGPFGWPPPPAAPRCRHRQGSGRATKVAGQEAVPADVEQTGLTITGAETQDKRLSVGNQGSLRRVRDFARTRWPLRGSSGRWRLIVLRS